MEIMKIQRRGCIGYRLFMINDRLWDSMTIFITFFREFEVFEYILLPQRSIIWTFFPFQ